MPFSSSSELFHFFATAIEWRERAKFEFTRNIDRIYQRINKIGKSIGLDKPDLTFVPLHLYCAIDEGSRFDQNHIFDLVAKNKSLNRVHRY